MWVALPCAASVPAGGGGGGGATVVVVGMRKGWTYLIPVAAAAAAMAAQAAAEAAEAATSGERGSGGEGECPSLTARSKNRIDLVSPSGEATSLGLEVLTRRLGRLWSDGGVVDVRTAVDGAVRKGVCGGLGLRLSAFCTLGINAGGDAGGIDPRGARGGAAPVPAPRPTVPRLLHEEGSQSAASASGGRDMQLVKLGLFLADCTFGEAAFGRA